MQKLSALMVGVALLGAACSQRGFNSSLQVAPTVAEGVKFDNYKTWKFARADAYPITGNQYLDDPRFREQVGAHMTAEMSELGYEHAEGETDFLMMIHVVVEDKVDEQKLDDIEKGYDMAWAQFSEDDKWKEGSLVLFAIDAKTGQQLWTSIATAKLYDQARDFDTALNRFKSVITRMLDDFPMRAQPQ